MNESLKDKKVAILATDGFEYVELMEPRKALDDAGAQTEIVSPKEGKIQGWNHDKPGAMVSVNVLLKEAHPDNYDALLLPGGVMNPDQLRTNPDAVHFVRAFFDARKPVAAICHGPWMLVEADVLEGRKLTSWPSLETRYRKCGRRLDRRGSHCRSWPCHQPQTARHSRIQSHDARGICCGKKLKEGRS